MAQQPEYSAVTPPVPTGGNEQPMLRPRRRRLWRDAIEMAILFVVIYTLVNLSTARAIVDGPSMQPSFYTGQLVIVNLLNYYLGKPQRGDVIVLHNPDPNCKDTIKNRSVIQLPFTNQTTTYDPCADLIKRVVGLPNDKIEMLKGRVYINGTLLDEPYIKKGFCERPDCDNKTWLLGPEEYFVLGDNRNNSLDSHSFGPINRDLIVGQAWIRYWPLPDVEMVPHPDYGAVNNPQPQPTPTSTAASIAATKTATSNSNTAPRIISSR